ncbi:MAG: Flp pilus assembly protein CpaB [Planctomycetaceae bacterium]
MSPRTIVVVGLALICGVSAAVGVNQLRSQSPDAPKAGMKTVVAAAVDIPRGVMVSKDLLKTVELPEKDVPAGAILNIEDAVERAVLIPLLKDDLLRDAKIATKDAGRGMAALVSNGMRAYTILTPTVASSVAGFIMPGNKVDVVLSVTERSLGDITGGGSATTLLQNVEILAVDQKLDVHNEQKDDAKAMRSVTLLVTPDQANKLSLAQSKGTLNLALRNDEDELAANTQPVSLRDLRFQQETPVVPVKAEVPKEIAPVVKMQTPAKPLRVRTLRGRDSGEVFLQPITVSAD